MYEYPAFPPRLMATSFSDLDKRAMLMARDRTLLPPPDMPIKHAYDDTGFKVSNFVAKQHRAVRDILSDHSQVFTYRQQLNIGTKWQDVTTATKAKLLKQYCLVHKVPMSGAEFHETRKMLIKTLLRLHMITEDLPLYTFFNRIRQYSLAELKKQCAELCIMADEKTPATARFKATPGSSED